MVGMQINEPSVPELLNNKIMYHRTDIDCEPKKHRKKIMKKIKDGHNELHGGGADNKGGLINCTIF